MQFPNSKQEKGRNSEEEKSQTKEGRKAEKMADIWEKKNSTPVREHWGKFGSA